MSEWYWVFVPFHIAICFESCWIFSPKIPWFKYWIYVTEKASLQYRIDFDLNPPSVRGQELPTAIMLSPSTKKLWEGNVFSHVCLSVSHTGYQGPVWACVCQSVDLFMGVPFYHNSCIGPHHRGILQDIGPHCTGTLWLCLPLYPPPSLTHTQVTSD